MGYFIFSKIHNEPPKVAQLAKKSHNLVTLLCRFEEDKFNKIDIFQVVVETPLGKVEGFVSK